MGILLFILIIVIIGLVLGLASSIITHIGVPLIMVGILYLLAKKFIHPSKSEYRGIPYKLHTSRESFHDSFLLKECDGEEVHTCTFDDKGRVVGAYVTFRGTTLSENKRKIREKEVERDDKARKEAIVPGMDSVKSRFSEVDGKKYFHYHRTHLIPFRFCLNDGEYANIMFTGTSRLNAGHTPELGIVPTNEVHSSNVESIISDIRRNPFYYNDIEKGSYMVHHLGYSLDDFERVADKLVYDSAESYRHMFKYGVECIYNSTGVIPSHVRVLFIDATLKRVLFSATLRNKL